MSHAIHPDGNFATRPPIGTAFRSPTGDTVTIAASWQSGVVFAGDAGCCSARDLVAHYTLLQREENHVSA